VESGGDYKALGKWTQGHRAIGKYQIMDNNIPVWTKEYLGTSYTVKQFINDPKTQDLLVGLILTDYLGNYDEKDVASIWFSGKPLKGNVSKDINGTSVKAYTQDVLSQLN